MAGARAPAASTGDAAINSDRANRPFGAKLADLTDAELDARIDAAADLIRTGRLTDNAEHVQRYADERQRCMAEFARRIADRCRAEAGSTAAT